MPLWISRSAALMSAATSAFRRSTGEIPGCSVTTWSSLSITIPPRSRGSLREPTLRTPPKRGQAAQPAVAVRPDFGLYHNYARSAEVQQSRGTELRHACAEGIGHPGADLRYPCQHHGRQHGDGAAPADGGR